MRHTSAEFRPGPSLSTRLTRGLRGSVVLLALALLGAASPSWAQCPGCITLNFPIFSGQITGVAVVFTNTVPRYFGTGTPPYGTYSDAVLTLVTGDARSNPFTPNGTFFSSRELVGSIIYSVFPVELMGFEVE